MLAFIPLVLMAQRNELLRNTLKTLVVSRNGEWNTIPYLTLGTKDLLHISFDDLAQGYSRYRYRIEPMTWDWRENTRLLPSEFLAKGMGDEPIEDFEESVNTSVFYTHYSFVFPNENTILKLSGNYRIIIYDDEDGTDVAIIPFFVVENETSIDASVSTDTDIDFNQKKQQLSISVCPKQSLNVHSIDTEIHTTVMQNLSPLTTIYDPHPDIITTNCIQWRHSKELIFSGGTEFNKIEMTSLRLGGMGIDGIRWHSPYYHATLLEDEPMANYVYDEDANGAFLIRSIGNTYPDVESDYVFVHFTLKTGKRLSGDVYVDGAFSNHSLTPEYLMSFNPVSKCYEAVLLIKQGYYNYQYVLNKNNNLTLEETQGCFYQTENRYTIFVYYSQKGSRYDRVVGLKDFRFVPSLK